MMTFLLTMSPYFRLTNLCAQNVHEIMTNFSQSSLKTLTLRFYKQARKILKSVKLNTNVFERWM